jgi:hypothetical protein
MGQPDSRPSDEVTLRADREHGGIGLAVPLIMLVAGIIAFLWVDSLLLIPLLGEGEWDTVRPLLRLLLAVVLGVGVGGAAEAILKRTWGSGRLLRLDEGGLTIEQKGKQPERIEWTKRVNVLRWRYPLLGYPRGGRERRIPVGRVMLACRLLQDDCSVIVHCYLRPKRARGLPEYARFTELNMADMYSASFLRRLRRPQRPSIPRSLLAGRNGQLWVAEKERWTTGFELEPHDFATLLDALEHHSAVAS